MGISGYDANGWHPTFIAYRAGLLVFFPLLIVLLIGGTERARDRYGKRPNAKPFFRKN